MPSVEAHPSAALAEMIAEVGNDLTPSDRRLASLMLEDPTVVAFATVADIAARVDVSGPTVVRFATKLGFDGYSALQGHVRRTLAAELRRPTDRLRRGAAPRSEGPEAAWDDARSTSLAAVESVYRRLTPRLITELAAPLATTDGRVWIVASDTASAAAHLLTSQLSLLRPGVHHLRGSDAVVAADLIDAADGDVVVAVDTPRYERRVLDTVRWLSRAGAHVVAITDGPLSPLAPLADTWCQVDVHAVGPFDSAVPTITVVELILAEVASQLRGPAARRLDRAEMLWQLHGVFVDD